MILGAGGAIGNGIANELSSAGHSVVLASRHPKTVTGKETLLPTDLLDAGQVARAVQGADIAYLTAGLPYNHKVWAAQWPVVMQHAIHACAQSGTKLVFFDNVYLYGRVQGAMTEQSPRNPCSRKGNVRAQLVQMLEEAQQQGNLQALIARAPDFYGTGTSNSMVNMVVLQRMALGKRPMWIGKPEVPHTFIFTQDAAKATALLANTAAAYGQTWHLPVAGPISGQEMAAMAAQQTGGTAKLNVMPGWMLGAASLFNSILRENQEMMYQYNEPYLFDSAKFQAAFPQFAVTSYLDGIAQTFAAFSHHANAH